MKEYRPTEGDCVDIMWPKVKIIEAASLGMEICIELPTGSKGVYEVVQGRPEQISNNTFSLPIENGGKYSVEYAAVHSIEILPVESETEAPEGLAEGMWFEKKAEGDFRTYWRIMECRNGNEVMITNLRDRYDVKKIIEAHNTVPKKLDETNILEMIKTCDLVVKPVDSDTPLLKAGKPSRVILEYDIGKVTKRRVIMDDKSCVIEDLDWGGDSDEG